MGQGERAGQRERVEELWSRWLADGKLGKREERELVDALRGDPPLLEELQRDQRTHDLMLSFGRARGDGEGFVRELVERIAAERDGDAFVSSFEKRVQTDGVSVPEARSRRRLLALWLLVPATAVAALFLGMRLGRDDGGRADVLESSAPAPRPARPAPAAWQPGSTTAAGEATPRPSVARIDSVSGSVLALDDLGAAVPGRRGDWLPSGAVFMTRERGARAALSFRDSTRLELEGDAVVSHLRDGSLDQAGGGKGAVLARGRMTVETPPQPGAGHPLVVITPHGEASALGGARFALTVDERSSRVDVDEGRVELARPDGRAPVAVSAAQYALAGEGQDPMARPRPRGVALLVVGRVNLRASDDHVRRRLEAQGFEVRIQGSGQPREEDLRRATLVLISSTVSARDISTLYRDSPLPLITWEPYLFDHLGMTGTVDLVDQGYARSTGEVVIENPSHPLAGGLSATTQMLALPRPEEAPAWQRRMSFGAPGPHARRIATWPGQPNRVAVFAYERGVPMPGLPSAPGKRVALFLHDYTSRFLTEAGWTLFDAAVSWAVAP